MPSAESEVEVLRDQQTALPVRFPPFVRLSDGSSRLLISKVCGGYIGGVTPVPIPNTEVKPTRADGTAREAVWESRSLPHLFGPPVRDRTGGPFFCPRAGGPRVTGPSDGARTPDPV